MDQRIRTVVYDSDLRIEAYRLAGMIQPFPKHFHSYYVVGIQESGRPVLSCRGRTCTLQDGDVLLFNPGDSHGCGRSGRTAMDYDYRGCSISQEVMLDLTEEVTGRRELPGFSQNVISDGEVACGVRRLHQLVMEGSREFGKEEALLMLLSLLLQRYGKPFSSCVPPCRMEIERACAFMEEHYAQRISLDQICRHAGLSKSTLLRAFAREKGVTPYSYLENIRIDRAKKLLEQGVPPAEAALRTGFSDQSHFTNYFSRFIGLAPGLYRDIFKHQEDIIYEK